MTKAEINKVNELYKQLDVANAKTDALKQAFGSLGTKLDTVIELLEKVSKGKKVTTE